MVDLRGLEIGAFGVLAGLGIFLLIVLVIIAAILIPTIIAQWKLFQKAGKKVWEAIVPFYNSYILIEISGLNWWYFLILIGTIITSPMVSSLAWLCTLASYYINFNIYYNIAKKTNQNEILYGILGIFVPFVALMILGFSSNVKYNKEVQVSPNGAF